MATGTKFYVLDANDFLPADEFESILGAIVRYYSKPKGPVKTLPTLQITYKDYPLLKDCEVTGGAKNALGFNTGLKEVAEAGAERSTSKSLTIETTDLTHRCLLNADDHLNQLLADANLNAAVSRWIHTFRKSKTACLVVGLLICEGGQVTEISGRIRALRADLTVPVVEAVTGASGLPLTASPGDPTCHVSRTKDRDTTRKGTLPGPCIVGLEYRWVKKPRPGKPPVAEQDGPTTDHQLGDKADKEGHDNGSSEDDASDDDSNEPPELMKIDWGKLVAKETM